jgi:hypothetical protein
MDFDSAVPNQEDKTWIEHSYIPDRDSDDDDQESDESFHDDVEFEVCEIIHYLSY